MAIMNTRLLGRVNSEVVYSTDDNGKDRFCTFTIVVKEGLDRPCFRIYISDCTQIELCHNEIHVGDRVLVEGIIEILFEDIPMTPDEIAKFGNRTVIKSDMSISCNNLFVFPGPITKDSNRRNHMHNSERTNRASFDTNVTLPF